MSSLLLSGLFVIVKPAKNEIVRKIISTGNSYKDLTIKGASADLSINSFSKNAKNKILIGKIISRCNKYRTRHESDIYYILLRMLENINNSI